MRILLRSIKTGHYFQRADKWTPDPASAQTFAQSADAIRRASTLGLEDVEVLLSFGKPCYDIRVALRNVRTGQAPSQPETQATSSWQI